MPPSFFSSTVPASATAVDTSWCAGVVTTLLVVPVGGLLNRLNRNISRRIRLTMSFSTDTGIVPFWMSVCSAVPK